VAEIWNGVKYAKPGRKPAVYSGELACAVNALFMEITMTDKREQLTLEKVTFVYPRQRDKNAALTGLIPIEVFTKWEEEFRSFMRPARIRAMYRGPRRNWSQSRTRREDAHSVLLYYKSHGE